ncbi:hypothetical protein IEQ44_11450 [Nocardioides sp. Y6]|uniref:Uncharacterized protein n=1 Tax=Nocardioides malaquae TaxID=2773426 RepID=A0ABR9RUL1_9ACTN|nr:hypothetical protein [Nocardioides malaquae]MBE7325270.1 hypothetical protein [Nocardioides malaquae]
MTRKLTVLVALTLAGLVTIGVVSAQAVDLTGDDAAKRDEDTAEVVLVDDADDDDTNDRTRDDVTNDDTRDNTRGDVTNDDTRDDTRGDVTNDNTRG